MLTHTSKHIAYQTFISSPFQLPFFRWSLHTSCSDLKVLSAKSLTMDMTGMKNANDAPITVGSLAPSNV